MHTVHSKKCDHIIWVESDLLVYIPNSFYHVLIYLSIHVRPSHFFERKCRWRLVDVSMGECPSSVSKKTKFYPLCPQCWQQIIPFFLHHVYISCDCCQGVENTRFKSFSDGHLRPIEAKRIKFARNEEMMLWKYRENLCGCIRFCTWMHNELTALYEFSDDTPHRESITEFSALWGAWLSCVITAFHTGGIDSTSPLPKWSRAIRILPNRVLSRQNWVACSLAFMWQALIAETFLF